MSKENQDFFKEALNELVQNIDDYEILDWDNKLETRKELVNCDDLNVTTIADNTITIVIKPIGIGGETNE